MREGEERGQDLRRKQEEEGVRKTERDRKREESEETKQERIYLEPCNMFTGS